MRFLLLCCLVLGFSSPVAARETAVAEAELTLEWNAEPVCASRERVERDVEQLLQGVSGPRRRVIAHVTSLRTPEQAWRVRLLTEVEGVAQERVFDAESCGALQDAVALMLAIAVNPQLSSPAGSASASAPSAAANTLPPVTAAQPQETPSEPRPLRAGRPAPTQQRDRRGSLWVSGALAGDAGTLPGVAAGAELVLAWQAAHTWLELGGTYWGKQAATAASSVTGADFQLLSIQARAGYAWKLRTVSVGPLLGVGLERFSAAGFQAVVANFEREATVPVAGVGAGLTWRPAGPLLVRLAAEALVLGSRPTFVVLNDQAAPDPIHQPARVVARSSLGVGFCFF